MSDKQSRATVTPVLGGVQLYWPDTNRRLRITFSDENMLRLAANSYDAIIKGDNPLTYTRAEQVKNG